MDIFAHGLWSFAIFHKKKYVWLATLFGVLPDLLSFGIIFVINLLNGNLHRGPPALSSLPEWLFKAIFCLFNNQKMALGFDIMGNPYYY